MACLSRVLVVLAVALAGAAPARAQDAAPAPGRTPAPARAQDAAPSTAPAPAPVKPWGPRLEFVGVPGCVDETDFRNAVATIFDGVDPFDPESPRVLRVTFTKGAGGVRVTLVYTPADGKAWPPEPISGAPCFAIVQAAARTASWRAGDPPKTPPPAPPPPPPPEPTPPPAPSKPPPDPVPSHGSRVAPVNFAELRSPPPPPPPPMDLTITLSTAVLMTAGFTANVGPALQLGAGLRHDWFSLDLELRGVFPGIAWARDPIPLEDRLPGHESDPLVPQYFDLSQLSAQLVPCVRFATYFAGCGVVGAYTLITQDATTTSFFPGWTIGPRFGVEVPLGERFAVFGFAEALFAPYGALQGYRDPSAPEKNDAPNVRWERSIVSGFFGAGVSVKFQ